MTEIFATTSLLAADSARDAGDWDTAIRAYGIYLAQHPEAAAIHVQYGHALKEAGCLLNAVDAYRRATELAPMDYDAWLHLAYLLRRTGPREDSLRAFARTWLLGHRTSDLVEALKNVAGYRLRQVKMVIEEEARRTGIPALFFADELIDFEDGLLVGEVAELPPRSRRAVIYLSGVDWGYRRQRPQHLATSIAANAIDVFFVSTVFRHQKEKPGFIAERTLVDGVYEVILCIDVTGVNSLHFAPSVTEWLALRTAIAALVVEVAPSPIIVVDNPAWEPALRNIGADVTLIYDCIDNFSAFPGAPPQTHAAEKALIDKANVVVASSRYLCDRISPKREVVFIPNGAQTGAFPLNLSVPSLNSITIVYMGLIAEWFDWRLIFEIAKSKPEWNIRLIGEVVTHNVAPLRQLPNVNFTGEVSYERLPGFLSDANVAIIPFKINELTHAVNPVKAYEYLSAGLPIVATRTMELEQFEWIRCACNASEFEAALIDEIMNDTVSRRLARSRWAHNHDWNDRAQRLLDAIERNSGVSHGSRPNQ